MFLLPWKLLVFFFIIEKKYSSCSFCSAFSSCCTRKKLIKNENPRLTKSHVEISQSHGFSTIENVIIRDDQGEIRDSSSPFISSSPSSQSYSSSFKFSTISSNSANGDEPIDSSDDESEASKIVIHQNSNLAISHFPLSRSLPPSPPLYPPRPLSFPFSPPSSFEEYDESSGAIVLNSPTRYSIKKEQIHPKDFERRIKGKNSNNLSKRKNIKEAIHQSSSSISSTEFNRSSLSTVSLDASSSSKSEEINKEKEKGKIKTSIDSSLEEGGKSPHSSSIFLFRMSSRHGRSNKASTKSFDFSMRQSKSHRQRNYHKDRNRYKDHKIKSKDSIVNHEKIHDNIMTTEIESDKEKTISKRDNDDGNISHESSIITTLDSQSKEENLNKNKKVTFNHQVTIINP